MSRIVSTTGPVTAVVVTAMRENYMVTKKKVVAVKKPTKIQRKTELKQAIANYLDMSFTSLDAEITTEEVLKNLSYKQEKVFEDIMNKMLEKEIAVIGKKYEPALRKKVAEAINQGLKKAMKEQMKNLEHLSFSFDW